MKMIIQTTTFIFALTLIGCKNKNDLVENASYPDVQIISAMKNVMWKGELQGKILLDTIDDRKGLYGVGPLEGLRGEILLFNGVTYTSKVDSAGSPMVSTANNVKAPFFVYTHVNQWDTISLPPAVHTIDQLDTYIDTSTQSYKRPFAFRLSGKVKNLKYHIQNLPPNTVVSNPKEAHAGQVKYSLEAAEVDIFGFFSTEHQGIFTHHDTNLHLHVLSKDLQHMGHMDQVIFENLQLFLPLR